MVEKFIEHLVDYFDMEIDDDLEFNDFIDLVIKDLDFSKLSEY